jgi:ketosteroid isomerase-like protein
VQWRAHRFRSARKIHDPLACEFSYNVSGEVAVTKENSNPLRPKQSERQGEQGDQPGAQLPDQQNDHPVASKEVEDFFQRLPGNFRWPKPNPEAIAAAVEAIQRVSGSSAAAQDLAADGAPELPCPACGGLLPANARFCVWCGIPVSDSDSTPAATRAGQTHVHHHYHHLGTGLAGNALAAAASAPATAADPAASSGPRGRAPGSPGNVTGGRAEAGARQLVQDWAQACNTKHIDDLLELYAADATLIRSSVPPVRSLPAIREFLISLLEAGLGDVEMESLRLEVMGDIALDLGRCKMLVPVAMGKRREERGKYLIVMVKQPVGTWKILADCWSSDLAVNTPPPEAAVRKVNELIPPPRKPR